MVDHGNESIPVISDENAFVTQCKFIEFERVASEGDFNQPSS